MIKVISAPEGLLPDQFVSGEILFSQYSKPLREGVGWFAKELPREIRAKGISVDQVTWDFLTIALSASAADRAICRAGNPDGWTREISLTVHLGEPLVWLGVKSELERMLRFLTGDFWHIEILSGGSKPPSRLNNKRTAVFKDKYQRGDCIALLSGGMDSLIGCIDLVANEQHPVFVSQIVPSNAEFQRQFAKAISDDSVMLQWNHTIKPPKGESETSTRGRSIVFFAFAAVAACALRRDLDKNIPIYVAENGFISLNIALNPGRIGSFSTKTTHPIYMKMLGDIWNAVGIKCRLILPYKFKTKGEMIAECKNRPLLDTLLPSSTSCSRFGTHGRRHCGRCVPCAVRAAAFLKAGIEDETDYKFIDSDYRRKDAADDIGAMAGACLRLSEPDFESTVSGDFLFASPEERSRYKDVFRRGLSEIATYLKKRGVLG